MIFLGVEYGAKYTLEGPNGIKAVFNDSTDADYVGDLSPESSGLDAPEIREDSADRVEADGAIFGDFFAGKRPVILQGTIIATSKAQRNERVGKLRAASNAKTTDAVLWWEDAAAGKLRVNLRRQQPLRVTKGYVKEFQLSMVAEDSRILGYTLHSLSGEKIESKVTTKFPGTVTSATYKGPLQTWSGAWTNIANVKAEDGVFATSTATLPQVLFISNFSFGLPVGAAVSRVEVVGKGKGSVANNYAWLNTAIHERMSNGVIALEEAIKTGDMFSHNFKFSASNLSLGGIGFESLAGGYLKTPLLNASTFGAAIIISGEAAGTLSVDDYSLTVTYAIGPELKVTNNGNVLAPSKITITSGTFIENPSVTNITTGETFQYLGSLEAGRSLIIDTEAFTVIEEGAGLVGTINRYNSVAVGSAWPQVVSGENTFLFGASASSEASGKNKFKVEWRDAWE